MKFRHRLNRHTKGLIAIKKTDRSWHFPFLASICVGLSLLIGWSIDKPAYGNLASIGSLVILYFTHETLAKRMIHLCVCAFGFGFAFTLGSLFSFNPYLSAFALGLVAFLTHLITSYFDLAPPRNFFFIMVAAVAVSLPFSLEMIPTRIGVVMMGAMLSVFLAFFYSVFIAKKVLRPNTGMIRNMRYSTIAESVILGIAMFLALLIGNLFHLKSPYWIPISAIAILQGKDLFNAGQRNLHRILGTFIGIGLTMLILTLKPSGLAIVLLVGGLQFIVEMLIVRNYGLAAIFITPLTIFLAENAAGNSINVHDLMQTRLLDTIIGSLIGILAGAVLHHRSFVAHLENKIRGRKFRFKKTAG